jgi:release factor glutamine methyltransferase
LTTVANTVAQGAERLAQGPHADRAKLDAETLLLHVTGANKAWLLTHGDDKLTDEQAQRYAVLLDRRFQGEPIQYITGEAEFFGIPFRVTPDVLIPRPETEHLVEQAIAFARDFQHPRIVDIGAGSGAIAITLAYHLPQARITSVDISEKALAIAKENAAHNQVTDRIRFLHGDLLTPVERERFDLVVSNPPYVPEVDRDTLSVEVRDYEPSLALFAGTDGLDIYRRLIPAAHEVLLSGGSLLMEIGYGQSDAIRALLAESDFGQIRFVFDLQGIPRVVCATSGVDNCGCGGTDRAGLQD